MSTAVKTRTAARGWATRTSKKLEKLCDQKEVNVDELRYVVDEFDSRLRALDAAQSAVEVELSDDKLESDLDEAGDFRDIVIAVRIKANIIIKLHASADTQSDQRNDSKSVRSVQARLPKIELPNFSGNVREWTTFWDQFSAVVDNNGDLPVITKFSYLLSLLQGEAKAAVQGLSLTSAHYSIACDLLKKRFGRPERIIFSHIQELLNITVAKGSSVTLLWKMYDDLQAHVRSLQMMGITGSQYGVVLTPLILSRLPADIRMEWAREGELHEGDLDFLLNFLQQEIERRERSQSFSKDSPSAREKVAERLDEQSPPTAAALHVQGDNNDNNKMVAGPGCPLCGRSNHSLAKCYNLTKIPVHERKPLIRQISACFKCLSTNKNHVFKKCSAKCLQCKRKHHSLLCEAPTDRKSGESPTKFEHEDSRLSKVDRGEDKQPKFGSTCVSLSDHAEAKVNTVTGVKSNVLLQTARVKVVGRTGTSDALVLFDTGSDKTYISESLVEKVGPEWVCSQNITYAAFGSNKASGAALSNVYEVLLKGTEGRMQKLLATEVPVICAPLFRPAVPNLSESLGEGIELVDAYEGQEAQVDLLIGLDSYWKVMTGELIHVSPGLVAQRSIFGWVLSGTVPGNNPSLCSMGQISHQLLCFDLSESCIRNMWELESIGIYDEGSDRAIDPVLTTFERKIQFSEGRYHVSLPWKDEAIRPKLLNNEKLARSRLEKLTLRLAKDPALETRYQAVLQDMHSEGIIEEVPSEEIDGPYMTYYMPHRPVVKESSLTTKVRPVFDASAKGFNRVSLNDCLVAGPNLIPDLPSILLRFRRWKVALTADVTKAFLQIGVQREDQDVHRFLWNDDGTVRVMRFMRVPFGNKSSPFLLNATVKHHLSRFPPSRVVKELEENLFVDDWLSGCDDASEGCAMLKEAQEIMMKAGMSLAKWGSNSEEVGDLLYREFHNYNVEESLKVLGMRWLAKADCFTFDGIEVPQDLCVTKRVVLSFVARLFDPLGFLTPYIMGAKCLFQELWKLGLDWDQVVPEDIYRKFTRWLAGLDFLRTWQIPRSYTGTSWSDIAMFQLHAFGDASESAYGACVYLHVQLTDGTRKSSLVLSRAKVAPLKRLSLPRLELLGALLCARLVVFVRKALQLRNEVAYSCWTDSTVTLAWIQSDPCKWKPFVGNRVAEIQRITDPSHWHHCAGKTNPADLVTRGISAVELMESDIWLRGPSFLRTDPSVVCVEPDTECYETSDETLCTSNVVLGDRVVSSGVSSDDIAISNRTQLSDPGPSDLEITRWSSLDKAMRVTAWVLRFLHNLKVSRDQRVSGSLSLEELRKAKLVLLGCVQKGEFGKEIHALKRGLSLPKTSSLQKLSPFIGEDGLLRVQGRLQFAGLPYDAKHPVIIPKGHMGVLLARHIHDFMKHAGVNSMLVGLRNQYWIIGGRRICKRVKRQCLSCQRQDAIAGSQTMAPLPAMRVTQNFPFAVTGLDHGGPLYCCDFAGKKFYVLLFTCAVIRAVHLELVESLTCEATVQAIRRFVARRGLPSILMSDNAKGFKAAKEKLLKIFGTDGPDWKFIVPLAPWWGGWWERLVGSFKSALKRSIGRRSLTRVELETSLHEIESCINSRPLTFVGDELDSGSPLTPSHFLIGRSGGTRTEASQEDPKVGAQDLVLRQELRTQVLDKFWDCWLNEYIRSLPTCKGSPANEGGVHEGSIVLIREQGYKRLQWPMGIVQKVFPGREGLVRTVEVKTTKGVFLRPVQLVHDLEISDRVLESPPESVEQANSTSDRDDLQLSDRSPSATQSNETPPSASQSETVKTRYGRCIKAPTRLDL